MGAFLALLSAAMYGAADFMGGLTARRVGTISAVLVSQGIGLITLGLLLLLPLFSDARPEARAWLWGGAAGLAGSIGVALLYHALSIGKMAIVAPTTAVCAVAIPVIGDVITGARLAPATIAGILLAGVAIVLISQSPGQEATDTAGDAPPIGRRGWPPGMTLALVSGAAIGLFFLLIPRAGDTAGLWPLFAARVVSIGLFGLVAIVGRHAIAIPREMLPLVAGAGVLDVFANACYLIATRYGSVSVIVTLASLYPASTVGLARLVLGERLSATQFIGIGCALIAVVLIVS